MKKVSKTLAIVLCLVMILSLTALANWTEFGGSSTHNGVIPSTETAPPISASPTINTYNANPAGAGGWDGIDSTPIMRTVTINNQPVTYAYVLYDSRNDGAHLLKYDCTNLKKKWSKKIGGATGFQLSTPLLVEGAAIDGSNDVIYLTASNADKNADVGLSAPVAIPANTATTVTFNNLELTTASNRVAVGIFLGHTTVQNQGTINTTGTASITLGSKTVNLTLSKTNSGTTTYKMLEEPVYENGALTGYDYYYYINHNITDSVGTGKTLSVTVTLNAAATMEYVELYGNTAALQVITNLNAADPTNTTLIGASLGTAISGQTNTPVTKYGDYLYFGTYSGTNNGSYYQYQISTGTLTTFTPGNSSFYWAGAYVDGTNVVFGGDNGHLFCTAVGANFGATSSTDDIDLTDSDNNGVSDAGNVRSSICKYGDYLYLTSQGGSNTSYIWKVRYDETDGVDTDYIFKRQLSGTSSTSTPTISNKGFIYVGTYGNQDYTKNGVRAIPLNNFTSGTIVDIASGTGSYGVSGSANFPVQSSVIVYTSGTGTSAIDYAFFTTNVSSTGAGYCYSFNGTNASKIWQTPSSTYALQGMAACNGYLVFGNDNDILYIIH